MNFKITAGMMLIYLLGSSKVETFVPAIFIGVFTYSWCRCVDWLVRRGYNMP